LNLKVYGEEWCHEERAEIAGDTSGKAQNLRGVAELNMDVDNWGAALS